MILSNNGHIKWEGDNVTLGAELSQLLIVFRREEPTIFLAALMTVAEKKQMKKGRERNDQSSKKWNRC